MCFFCGNDFLPHLPSLSIHEGALDMLMDMYRSIVPTLGGYLTDAGVVRPLHVLFVLLFPFSSTLVPTLHARTHLLVGTRIPLSSLSPILLPPLVYATDICGWQVDLERTERFVRVIGAFEDDVFRRRRRNDDYRKQQDQSRVCSLCLSLSLSLLHAVCLCLRLHMSLSTFLSLCVAHGLTVALQRIRSRDVNAAAATNPNLPAPVALTGRSALYLFPPSVPPLCYPFLTPLLLLSNSSLSPL
jgi:hypothetical protein